MHRYIFNVNNSALKFYNHIFICKTIYVLCFLFFINQTFVLAQKNQTTIFLNSRATPIAINADTNTLYLQDFFLDPEKIHSLDFDSPFLMATKDSDKQVFKIIPNHRNATKEENAIREGFSLLEPLSTLRIQLDRTEYALLLKKSNKLPHLFQVATNADKDYKTVAVAGSFSNWTPIPLNYNTTQKEWQLNQLLPPGVHQYKVILDGKWQIDPANRDSVDNNIGGFNSVINIGNANVDKLPRLYTHQIDSNRRSIEIGIENKAEKIYVFWDQEIIQEAKITEAEDFLSIKIPKKAKERPYSFLKIYAYNDFGIANDLLIPLHYDQVIQSPKELTQLHKEQTILYFLMVDRFHNGNPKNDEMVQDSAVALRANYYGGDLAGIRAKIAEGYFKELGINAIWLSPIMQNPSTAFVEWPAPKRKYSGYHGYWPISFTQVDHRFGTNEELKSLVEFAHQNNIQIILDFVANHVHEDHPLYQAHPDWATTLDLPNGQKNIRIWEEQRLTTWFDTFLPSWDFSREEVIDTVADAALHWIKTYQLDGFRHDATKHIPNTFWRALTQRLKEKVILEENRPLLQIGETFGSRELIGSYVDMGQMDGQFDFNLYFDARSVFVNDTEPFTNLTRSLQESLDYYGHHSLMGNITGNHDMPRFISYASGTLRFDEDAKAAGWERTIDAQQPGYNKQACLNAFVATIPGIPVIYYGDEIGLPGGNDPDNRRPMQFEEWNFDQAMLHRATKEVLKTRQNQMALIYGEIDILHASAETLVYTRTYFDQTVLLAFNKTNTKKAIRFKLPKRLQNVSFVSIFKGKPQKKDGELSIEVYPHFFDLLVGE